MFNLMSNFSGSHQFPSSLWIKMGIAESNGVQASWNTAQEAANLD